MWNYRTSFLGWFCEWFSPATKAARLYGRACRLEAKGVNDEAFDLTQRALESLGTPEEPSSDPRVALILPMTVTYAELAERIGRPRIADTAIKRAIDLAERSGNPSMDEHIKWLRNRLKS